ncbi:cupin domain-containing protein [Streptosporangium roseum]|uniref:Cupin type-2 domain-containing protein n=1 Tax=Streptosporangium roseum (strain ATCC 12428 / DSM 43021 / JCM 3005 / KCTC 9067 / NCIMB 10171 / NRRL 2505 / NI 9100) TaxID=479432 RepID=D2AS66_STRRD|nr:cupin domain-containing protein [Streptosporangium roseum]ACZ86593.1 conserved hypothetical protein [Streptosporangium roseum DSM 43021]
MTVTTMFPQLRSVELAEGVRARAFAAGETLVQVVEIAPGAVLPPHSHDEAQAGILVSGRLTLLIGEEERVMEPLRTAYMIAPGVPHAARNPTSEPTVSIDLKRLVDRPCSSGFIELGDRKKTKLGLFNEFFVGDWFEIMISTLEAGGQMPDHRHRHEQIGYVIGGAAYRMTVGGEEHEHGPGDAYYAAPMVSHSAVNDSAESSLNFVAFIPPRYHRPADDGSPLLASVPTAGEPA